MTGNNSRRTWMAGAASVAALALAVPAVVGAAQSEPATEVPVTIHDALKPAAEILISSPCTAGDTGATLETSFGGPVEMTPAADSGELIAYVTAPVNIGPGPQEGHHTATVTCSSGVVGSAQFPDSGNGTHVMEDLVAPQQ